LRGHTVAYLTQKNTLSLRVHGGTAHLQHSFTTRAATSVSSVGRPVNIERGSSGTSVIDVLDRVLDKGIVIDAWVRVSVVGIDLVTVEARVVVASIETFMRYSELVQRAPTETTVKQLRKQGRQVQVIDRVPSTPTTSVQNGRPPRARRAWRGKNWWS
jgi:hypothetical protein